MKIAENDTTKKFETFNDCDEIYHGRGKRQIGNSQIHNPYSWANVETITPRMVSKRPTVIFRPRENYDQGQSEIMQSIHDYWWEKDRVFNKVVSWVKDSLTYGTGIVKVYWNTEKETVKSYQYDETGNPLVDENGEYVEEETEITTFDDPTLENVNIYDFFVDPRATSIQTAEWAIHRFHKTIDELKESGLYKNLNKLEDYLTNKTERSDSDKKRHEHAFGSQGEDDSTVDKVEVLEMWDKNGMTVLGARNVVIREKERPFWHGRIPFVRLVDHLVSQEFYGKGEVEPVIKLQHALNTIQNQSIDNKTQSLMPMWKIYGEIDENELIARPNGVVHMTSATDIAEKLESQDMTRNAVEEMSNVKSDIQQALGIYDYTKGAESGVNKTATGIGLVQEAANARFAHKIQLLEESLKEMGTLVISLYQQFMTSERVIRVVGKNGEDYVRLKPQDIAGNYDIDVESGSTRPINKEAERQDIVNLKQLMGDIQDPEFQMELDKKILDKYDMKDLEDSLGQAFEKMQAEQQQQQEMQQQQMQQQMQENQLQPQIESQQNQEQHQREIEKIQAKELAKQGIL